MWIDERGSEVLELPECRRLLSLGAKEHRHGHLGVADGEAPVVLPVNYVMSDGDILIVVGEGLFHRLPNRLVSFQVDGILSSQSVLKSDETRWSVLVKGLATEEREPPGKDHLPVPEVPEPGRRVVRIRADAVTGRKLGPRL